MAFSKNFRNMSHIPGFGLIVYYHDPVSHETFYHIAQRRDSVGYINFLHGRVHPDKLTRVFNFMTPEEKHRLLSHPFDDLWRDLYSDSYRFKTSEYEFARNYHRNFDKEYLENLISISTNTFRLDWCIPKGKKKHLDEPDLVCSLREYREETRNRSYLEIHDTPPILSEVRFDNRLYQTYYFIAKSKFQPRPYYHTLEINGIRRVSVSEETSTLEWATLTRCKELLPERLYNTILIADELIKTSPPFILLKDAVPKYNKYPVYSFQTPLLSVIKGDENDEKEDVESDFASRASPSPVECSEISDGSVASGVEDNNQ